MMAQAKKLTLQKVLPYLEMVLLRNQMQKVQSSFLIHVKFYELYSVYVYAHV